MASQLIGTTETGWFNPGVNPPPFDMKLLLMVAGSRSEDCGRTFETYTVVMTAYVQQQGPGDEYDDEPAFDEYMSGDQTDFLDFQFDLKDEDGEVLDWYSDSIVAWAYYPLGIAQTAVNVERERQAALVPNCEVTGDLGPLQAMAGRVGQMLMPMPASGQADGDLARKLAEACKEFGEFVTEISGDLADGRVTPNEMQRIEREAGELIGKVHMLLAHANAIAEASKPKAPNLRAA